MKDFLDIVLAQEFLAEAAKQYEKAPGWFTSWLDDLFIRLSSDWRAITLDELCELAALHNGDGWEPEPFAVNAVYKLFHRLGRNTSGIAGF